MIPMLPPPLMPSPNTDTIPPTDATTKDMWKHAQSSLSSSSLPSALSDRMGHTCITNIVSNTPSRQEPDPFMTNGSPR